MEMRVGAIGPRDDNLARSSKGDHLGALATPANSPPTLPAAIVTLVAIDDAMALAPYDVADEEQDAVPLAA